MSETSKKLPLVGKERRATCGDDLSRDFQYVPHVKEARKRLREQLEYECIEGTLTDKKFGPLRIETGAPFVDDDDCAGLKKWLLYHGCQPYGDEVKFELTSMTIYDTTKIENDDCETLAHFYKRDFPNSGSLTMYEVSIPVHQSNLLVHVPPSPGSDLVRWGWFQIEVPLIQFSKQTPGSPVYHPQIRLPVASTWVVFAAPLSQLVLYPQVRETKYVPAPVRCFIPEARGVHIQNTLVAQEFIRYDFQWIANKQPLMEFMDKTGLVDAKLGNDFISGSSIPSFEWQTSIPVKAYGHIAMPTEIGSLSPTTFQQPSQWNEPPPRLPVGGNNTTETAYALCKAGEEKAAKENENEKAAKEKENAGKEGGDAATKESDSDMDNDAESPSAGPARKHKGHRRSESADTFAGFAVAANDPILTAAREAGAPKPTTKSAATDASKENEEDYADEDGAFPSPPPASAATRPASAAAQPAPATPSPTQPQQNPSHKRNTSTPVTALEAAQLPPTPLLGGLGEVIMKEVSPDEALDYYSEEWFKSCRLAFERDVAMWSKVRSAMERGTCRVAVRMGVEEFGRPDVGAGTGGERSDDSAVGLGISISMSASLSGTGETTPVSDGQDGGDGEDGDADVDVEMSDDDEEDEEMYEADDEKDVCVEMEL